MECVNCKHCRYPRSENDNMSRDFMNDEKFWNNYTKNITEM